MNCFSAVKIFRCLTIDRKGSHDSQESLYPSPRCFLQPKVAPKRGTVLTTRALEDASPS